MEIINFIKNVINKKFNEKAKGYDPDEVDETLDEIFDKFKIYIEEYKKLEEENKELKKQVAFLETKKDELTKQNTILNSNLEQIKSSGLSFEFINQRINSLENKVDKTNNESTTKKNK